MSNLRNHPQFWLRDDAAASFDRLEARVGIVPVNSAGRTEAQQQGLINAWNRGGAKNRPPYLYKPQTPASASNHVRDGGRAVDTPAIAFMQTHGGEHGWFQPAPKSDPVHFEYDPARDKHRGATASPATDVTRRVQSKLKTSYPLYASRLVVDGIMGPNTRAAVKEFQRRSGLVVDGIIGPKTLKALGL